MTPAEEGMTMAGMFRGAMGAGLALAAAMSLVATGASAQTAPKWVVDHAQSQLLFDSQAEGAAFEGHFDDWDADIRFDPKALGQSKVSVTVATGSAVTGDSSRDQTAHGADWFASVMFPKATFTTRTIKDLGGGKYEADGDLAIKGVTQPLALPFTLTIAGDTATMTGEATVDRSRFGVGQGDYGGADTVPLSVTVKVVLAAHLAK